MSLFDVIRYPISDPPTPEEIEALPQDLYNTWLELRSFTYANPRDRDRGLVASWYSAVYDPDGREYMFEVDRKEVEALRTLIKSYNP
jgi:hypothetical protein